MKWTTTSPAFKREINTFKSFKCTYSTPEVQVYDVNPGENKYVIKKIRKNSPSKMTEFLREIEYGSNTHGLRKGVHVRVHAYWIHPELTSGVYVMDHASFGAVDVKQTMTAKKYMQKYNFDPVAFTTKFRNALQSFYRVFQGFHGDLHASNVMVNLGFGQDSKVKSVVIIDYANITPFVKTKNSQKLKNVVQNTFKALPEYFKYAEYPEKSGIQVKWSRTGDVPVRSNVNMLHKLREWKPLRVAFSKKKGPGF